MKNEKIVYLTFGFIGAIYSLISIYDYYYQKKIIDNPNWEIKVKPNQDNLLNDILEIKSKNNNINIQEFQISLKGEYEIKSFNSKREILSTSELKIELSKFIDSNFSTQTTIPSQYFEFSVPVLISVKYEYLGESKINYRIYEYKFRYYTVGALNKRIKSIDYLFIKEVYNSLEVYNELILINLECCLKNYFDNEDISWELVEIDKKFVPLIKFYDDSKLFTKEIEVEFEDEHDSIRNYLRVYYFPFTSDSLIYVDWIKQLNHFKTKKMEFNFKINSSIDTLSKIIEDYSRMENIDIGDQNKSLQLFVNELNFFAVDSNRNYLRWKKALNGVFDGMIEYKYKEFDNYFKK